MESLLHNPIVPGFFPDPSICRVGEDYYMVCSSFELCPAIPIFHSRDLANWELIGNVMSPENGFIVGANTYSGGVMAPTIRYHDGVFYVINCNFDDRGNFIVTATDPAGPWSKPVYLDDVPGIDASIFFDDDGSCYVMGTGLEAETPEGITERCIWVAAFDTQTMKCKTAPRAIWNSALRGASSPEAPHIYHINGWYYLLIAEGGTEHYHAITMARSRRIDGWYEGNPANPVLTHRHLGFAYPIGNVGHGDLIDTPNGDWGCVMLASRLIDGFHKNLGRETYYVPVRWERDWAVFSPETGRVEWSYPAPLPLRPVAPLPAREDFNTPELPPHLCMWGVPYRRFWSIADSKLSLQCLRRPIDRPIRGLTDPTLKHCDPDDVVSLVGRRQTSPNFHAACAMHFLPEGSNAAGLMLMQGKNHQLRLERLCVEGQQTLRLVQVTNTLSGLIFLPNFRAEQHITVLAEIPCDSADLVLAIHAVGQQTTFLYGASEDALTPLVTADASVLNPEEVGPMVGTLVALYATGNGRDSDQCAVFDWFEYQDQ